MSSVWRRWGIRELHILVQACEDLCVLEIQRLSLWGEKSFGEKCLFLGSTLISLSGEEDIWLKSLTGMWTSPGIHPPHVLSEELGG